MQRLGSEREAEVERERRRSRSRGRGRPLLKDCDANWRLRRQHFAAWTERESRSVWFVVWNRAEAEAEAEWRQILVQNRRREHLAARSERDSMVVFWGIGGRIVMEWVAQDGCI